MEMLLLRNAECKQRHCCAAAALAVRTHPPASDLQIQ